MEYHATSNRISKGNYIIPIQRVRLFSSDDWEMFIEEWLDIKKADYFNIKKSGGAGDKGIDIAAYNEDPQKAFNYKWDCYQCKHYSNALTPTDVYVEFGKIIYYSYKKEYPVPQKYYFISPHGCGTSLFKLLENPENLQKKIFENWDAYCRLKITAEQEIILEGDFLVYFQNFDFTIFNTVQCKVIIEEHKKHQNHLFRFGGDLQDRPKLIAKDISNEIKSTELTYVNNLLKTYNSDSNNAYSSIDELDGKYKSHFINAREAFHWAEQLRVLYRDSLPVNTFEDFQQEIYDGVINTCTNQFNNSFEKVKKVEDMASGIVISSNPLKDVCVVKDKKGVCHQLSNDGRLHWDE